MVFNLTSKLNVAVLRLGRIDLKYRQKLSFFEKLPKGSKFTVEFGFNMKKFDFHVIYIEKSNLVGIMDNASSVAMETILFSSVLRPFFHFLCANNTIKS